MKNTTVAPAPIVDPISATNPPALDCIAQYLQAKLTALISETLRDDDSLYRIYNYGKIQQLQEVLWVIDKPTRIDIALSFDR